MQMEIADFDEKIFMVEEEQFELMHNLSEIVFEELINELIKDFILQ